MSLAKILDLRKTSEDASAQESRNKLNDHGQKQLSIEEAVQNTAAKAKEPSADEKIVLKEKVSTSAVGKARAVKKGKKGK